jgi:hypothetical protein
MTLFIVPSISVDSFLVDRPANTRTVCLYSEYRRFIYKVMKAAVDPLIYSDFLKRNTKYRVYSLKVDIKHTSVSTFMPWVNEQFLVALLRAPSNSEVTTFEVVGFKTKEDILVFKLSCPTGMDMSVTRNGII